MIAEFRVSNFFSIRSEQSISFVATSDKFMADGFCRQVTDAVSLLKIGVIYGANASGKSNVLKAFSFFRRLMLRVPEDRNESLKLVPFLLDKKEINAYKKRGGELAGQYFELKSKYDKLCEERRYWATQQWAKHLFRWLFLKRHWFFWGLYTFFLSIIGISMYLNDALREENQRLYKTEMKYRFIRAMNTAPLTLQYLDDAFEGGDAEKLQIVQTTVRNYEQALIQKSDSIVRAEREKQKQLK